MSPNVDLDRPMAARLSSELLSEVVLGLVTGYHEAAQFSDCVEVARAAAQLFRKGLPDEVKSVVAQCMVKQPVAKLKLLGAQK
jgi:hypothetical protein